MQTSRHRCPGSCTTTQRRRPLSSSSLSSTTYASTRRRSRRLRSSRRRGPGPGRANRGRRAKNAGVAIGRVAAAACRWRQNASSITATPGLARGDGVLARSRAGPSRRAKNEPTPPIRHRRDPSGLGFASAPPRGSFQSQPGLYPAKAATAPGQGIVIEFLPTDPCQTARGDASVPRTHDGETRASAAAPGPRSSRAPSRVSTRPRPA